MYSLMKQTGVVVALGLVSGTVAAAVRGLPQVPSAASDQTCAAPDLLLPEPADIHVQEAYELANRGSTVFVDCRSVAEYRQGHVAGAISLPAENLQLSLEARQLLAMAGTVIAYCDAACSRSRKVAQHVMEQGITDVRILEGGLEAWTTAGFPAESGDLTKF